MTKPSHRSATGALVIALGFTSGAPGCGGNVEVGSGGGVGVGGSGGTTAPEANFVVVPDGAGCVATLDPAQATSALTAEDPSDAWAVAELYFSEECTNAGGQYVLAKEVGGFRTFWLGEHACYFWPPPVDFSTPYGAVRYRITAGIFTLPAGICVQVPGESTPPETDASTLAIVGYLTLADAQAAVSAFAP